ncbi:mycofactocin-coupled SDR family oxidoreductase [Mycobacterium sp. C31M]
MTLLDGKVAFITGVARGQGRSHAVRMAEEGADIIGVDICADMSTVPYALASEEDLEETARLIEKTGRRSVLRKADVRSLPALRAVAEEGLSAFGHIDVVVANAGIAPMGVADTEEGRIAVWDQVIAVNLTGVWNTVLACAPSMVERGEGGSIILVSSTAGLKAVGYPGQIGGESYGAAKHGVVGLMRHFALELSPASIRVNTVHPAGVATPMVMNPAMEKFLEDFAEGSWTPSNLLPVEILEPDDISNAVLYLGSDLSRYVTGVTLPVDAGFVAK